MAARIARAAFKAEAMVLGMVPKSMLPMVQVYTNLGASLVQSASRLAPWAGAAGIFGVRADLPHWQWLLLTHLPFSFLFFSFLFKHHSLPQAWMVLPIVKQNLLDAVGYEPPEHEYVQDVPLESQFSFSKEAVGEVVEVSGGRWKKPLTVAERQQQKLEKQMSAYNFSKDEVGSVPETEKSG